jgi:hypothetical protein
VERIVTILAWYMAISKCTSTCPRAGGARNFEIDTMNFERGRGPRGVNLAFRGFRRPADGDGGLGGKLCGLGGPRVFEKRRPGHFAS